MLASAPPDVMVLLRGERPDFLVHSRHVARRSARVGTAVLGALLLAGAVALGVVMAVGEGTMSVGSRDDPRVVTGSERVVYAAVVALVLAAIVALVFGLMLRSLSAPGPWVAGLPRGLLLHDEQGPRLHPWSDFINAQRSGPDVVLYARIGVRIQRRGSSFRHHTVEVVAPEDPDRVLAACRARIDAALAEPAPGT